MEDDVKQASKQAINSLIESIPVATDDILQRQGIIALVGPTGVGKTTTIAKLAARYVMAHGQDQHCRSQWGAWTCSANAALQLWSGSSPLD